MALTFPDLPTGVGRQAIETAVSQFNLAAVEIRRERARRAAIDARKKARRAAGAVVEAAQPWNDEYGYLKRATYRIVRHFNAAPVGKLAIQEIVRDWDRIPRKPTYDENPFHWGLLGLHPHESDWLSKQARGRFARELLLADRADVPELYLIGFIYQLGRQGGEVHEHVRKPGKLLMLRRIGFD